MVKLDKNKIESIINYLLEKVDPYLIILFGSVAKGYMRADSDVDLGFLSDKKLDNYEIFLIAQGLADILGREVDLVDLDQASTVFQAQVISSGKVIYCNNEKRRKLFEIVVLKKYVRLNEERKPILEKIKERGNIYG
ncbi:MAG: DNA polymerase subunit beta [Desulfitibacter sp. BRH_c19]|nr:MAG: DNA polymerase subunit beta [Desulfitibacter sp. BRH_c19]